HRVLVFGICDEPALVHALSTAVGAVGVDASALVQPLQAREPELRLRLAQLLRAWGNLHGSRPLLFVLDDFEHNFEPDHQRLKPEAARTLQALLFAIDEAGAGLVLMTSRYALPEPFARRFQHEPLSAMRGVELDKKVRRLRDATNGQKPGREELEQRAIKTSDGNPRLIEWLFQLLDQPGLDLAVLFERLNARATEFRESVLVAELVATLSPPGRRLLGDMLDPSAPKQSSSGFSVVRFPLVWSNGNRCTECCTTECRGYSSLSWTSSRLRSRRCLWGGRRAICDRCGGTSPHPGRKSVCVSSIVWRRAQSYLS
ncbi:hypothetical protein ACFL5O_12310, partial [Myxococcota bacterium]